MSFRMTLTSVCSTIFSVYSLNRLCKSYSSTWTKINLIRVVNLTWILRLKPLSKIHKEFFSKPFSWYCQFSTAYWLMLLYRLKGCCGWGLWTHICWAAQRWTEIPKDSVPFSRYSCCISDFNCAGAFHLNEPLFTRSQP